MKPRPSRLSQVALGAVTLLALGLVAAAVLRTPQPPAPADGSRLATYALPSPSPSPAPVPWASTLKTSLARLDDPTRPFTVLLVGDSTGSGINPTMWDVRLMRWLSEQTDRPWEAHAWHQQVIQGLPPGYFKDPWKYGKGKNAPIVFWNASAGGKGWDYTAENEAKLVPPEVASVDLLLVNHGHNVRPGTDYYFKGRPFIAHMHARFPEAAAVFIKQNPEKGERLQITALPEVFRQIDMLAAINPGVTVVDVHKAFVATGHPLQLVDETELHPTSAGYQLWFDLVRKEMVKAAPTLLG